MKKLYTRWTTIDIQDVMDVEKTVSPNVLFGEPNDRPWKDCPVLRCKTAGKAEFGPVWVAKPRESVVGIRMIDRANMMICSKADERENEVTQIAVENCKYLYFMLLNKSETDSSRVLSVKIIDELESSEIKNLLSC